MINKSSKDGDMAKGSTREDGANMIMGVEIKNLPRPPQQKKMRNLSKSSFSGPPLFQQKVLDVMASRKIPSCNIEPA